MSPQSVSPVAAKLCHKPASKPGNPRIPKASAPAVSPLLPSHAYMSHRLQGGTGQPPCARLSHSW